MPGSGPTNLTGSEALLWALDTEPALRSTFISVSLLDRPADLARLRARLAGASEELPLLRQRVVEAPLGLVAPRWAEVGDFDIARHVRAHTMAAPGDLPQLLEFAAAQCADPFDRAHPLWELTAVDGLAGGRGALLTKLHHVLSDGVGAVRMSASFLDLAPDAAPPDAPPPEAAPPEAAPTEAHALPEASANALQWLRAATDAAGGLWRGVEGLAGAVNRVARSPDDAWNAARSLARQATAVEAARSPLWTARAHDHRFEVTSFDLEAVRATGKALGGTVNDAFVTIVAAAAGAYHRLRGVDVEQLRVSVPVSLRHDRVAARNAWAPARVLVPTGELPPAERFAEVHARLAEAKSDPSLGLADGLAGSARLLPRPLLVWFALHGVATVDFACSNVRGAPFDLWVAGAHVDANYPFGPTAGVAFNATVLSYRGSLDLGLNVDRGAVDDPGLLRQCIDDAGAELLASRRRRRPARRR